MSLDIQGNQSALAACMHGMGGAGFHQIHLTRADPDPRRTNLALARESPRFNDAVGGPVQQTGRVY
ncbi:hypothetical protein HQ621_19615 [Pseudomonas simiae]|jgi:hypothetical protein|nr:hypothetical protein [Pseudomonas simiae]